MLGGVTAMLPIYAADILDAGELGLGLLRSAIAIGAALCALVLTHYPIRRNNGSALLIVVAVFGFAIVIFGISTLFWVSFFALVIAGAADMVSVVIRIMLLQLATPDAMRGRVSAVNGMFIGASNELGEFESGIVAVWIGVLPCVIVGGVGTVLIAYLWSRAVPETSANRFARREVVEPIIAVTPGRRHSVYGLLPFCKALCG